MEHKFGIRYRDGCGEESARIIWPFALGFFDRLRVAVAGHWVDMASAAHVRLSRWQEAMQVCHDKAALLQRIRPGDRVEYYLPSTAFRGKDRLQAVTAIGRVRQGEP